MKRIHSLLLYRFSVVISTGFFLVFFTPCIARAAFSINSVSPNTIHSPDEVITITASASGLQNSTQYFQIMLTKEGESNYFGFTKNLKDEWYQYKSSPSSSDLSSYFFSFTPVNGIWNGTILGKVDSNDSGYKGPGNYTLKLAKYITSSASYSTNTQTVSIQIVLTPTPTITPTPTDVPSPTKPPTPQPTATPTKVPTITPLTIVTQNITPLPTKRNDTTKTIVSSHEAVLGENTRKTILTDTITTVTPAQKKQHINASVSQNLTPFFSIGGGFLILGLCAILTFWPQIKQLWKK